MTTANRAANTTSRTAAPAPAAASKPPKAPKDPNKASKPWIKKRVDNGMRALRALTNLSGRLSATSGETREQFKTKAGDVRRIIKQALTDVEAAVKLMADLAKDGYKPEGEKTKLEVGTIVWLRGAVWVNKFHGLYQPDEIKDLKVVAIKGKMVKAVAANGTPVVQPSSAFRTEAVDYAEAVKKAEEEQKAA